MSFISIRILAASSDESDWRFWVFIAALLAFYYAFNNWYAKRRRRTLAQLAPSMGFLWLDTMPETPRGIAFLRTGLGGELSNAMTGARAGCEVTLFDFEYETGISARTERTHAQTIAAFRSAHPILPAFQFGPEPVMRKMFTVGSEEQFKFETPLSGVSASLGHYVLRSTEQTAANALFDSEMLKFFNDLGLQHEPWFLEGNQEWLLVWEHNNIVPPQNYPWFLQQTSTIAATVFGCAKMKRAATAQIVEVRCNDTQAHALLEAGLKPGFESVSCKPGEDKMPRFCASCCSPVAEGALACASCGATAGQAVGERASAASATAITSLTENLAGALAYVTFLPAVFFLLFEPYNKNPFVRFHSFQCIFLNVACLVLEFALMRLDSARGWASLLILPLCLAAIGLWIVLVVAAYRGGIFKLPVIGDLAEKRANNA